ncbi:MAG TPA: hypothetical protein ENG01_00580 [Candidatus Aenigmarchaeota archaeon]|nr:hypothetical protein [Candidatus Aenigmarchaeota archaeon]HEX32892.1 hypothetical protein [Candidatus Aenigmarchaeota archaeon]
MVDFVKIAVGLLVLILSLLVKELIINVSTLVEFGMDRNEAYNLVSSVSKLNPIIYTIIVGISAIIIIKGAQS